MSILDKPIYIQQLDGHTSDPDVSLIQYLDDMQQLAIKLHHLMDNRHTSDLFERIAAVEDDYQRSELLSAAKKINSIQNSDAKQLKTIVDGFKCLQAAMNRTSNDADRQQEKEDRERIEEISQECAEGTK